jgi:glycosyltransferase involved in cell wall biosynthesis
VDDGSQIEPRKICQEHGAELLVAQADYSRRGPSVAWNVGLRAASGDVVACTHPEIVPDMNVARYLYGVCAADARYLPAIETWSHDSRGKRWIHSDDMKALGETAVRANVSVYRLQDHHRQTIVDDDTYGAFRLVEEDPAFWCVPTEFGGLTNDEIRKKHSDFFWNNLFAMRREIWAWMNYFRDSPDWGIDDTDFQERNVHLKIPYVFSNSTHGYHQWHTGSFRSGLTDLVQFNSLEEARLLNRGGVNGEPLKYRLGNIWE